MFPVFAVHSQAIKLYSTKTKAEPLTLFLAATQTTTVKIDWGDGKQIDYPIGTALVSIDNIPTDTVRVYGDFIKSFVCDNAGLTSLDVKNCPDLYDLSIINNQLSVLDVSQNAPLYSVNCSGNALKDINISKNISLGELYCGRNSLSYLDVFNNKNLTVLNFEMNEISFVDVSNNSLLETLVCDSNMVEFIDVSQNIALVELSCKSNYLLELDVSNNTNLTNLDCGSNGIEKLDFSANSKLSTLYCNNNLLANLDVSSNSGLRILDCAYNKIESLLLPKSASVSELYCESNKLSIGTLPSHQGIPTYYFSPQSKLAMSPKEYLTGDAIALDNQLYNVDFDGTTQITSFVWKNPKGTALTPGIDYSEAAGIFTFLKAQPDSIYCEMTNPAFKGLTLQTENIWVGSATVTGIIPEETAVQLLAGDSYLINYTLEPSGATDDIIFFSSNESIATISGTGLVTSFAEGAVTITLQSPSGKVEATVVFDVVNEVVVLVPAIKLFMQGTSGAIIIGASEAETIQIDVGTGQLMDYQIGTSPQLIPFSPRDTIKIYGDKINFLSCSNQNVSALDVRNCSTLEKLNCEGNAIFELDLSANAALTDLICSRNELNVLDVSSNTALDTLFCTNLAISELDVSQNIALVDLRCDGNLLSSLDVTLNPELKTVTFSSCGLKSIDVSANSKLELIDAYNNGLSTLDVSNNTALKSLYCSNNQLTSLDLSQNTFLEEAECANNRISNLDFPATELQYFGCENNNLTIFSLPDPPAIVEYTYAPQAKMPLPQKLYTVGESVDLSLQLYKYDSNVIQQTTSYLWMTAKRDTLKVGIDYTETNGTFVFLAAQTDSIFCEMFNPALSQLVLRTENIWVDDINLISITPAESFTELFVGNTYQIKYTLDPADAVDDIIFISSDENITSVSGTGLVTGVSEGFAEVTLSSPSTGISAIVEIDVIQEVVAPTPTIKLFSDTNNDLTFSIGASSSIGVLVDWGNGQPIEYNVDATPLSISGTKTDTVKIYGDGITYFDCKTNELTVLDVSNCALLEDLICSTNSLTDLNVSQNTNLSNLQFGANLISVIDLSINSNLKKLICSYNKLNDLSLYGNSSLTYLDCSGNGLSFLDISYNDQIDTLACGENQLSYVDVYFNTALEYLDFNNNSVDGVFLENNIALKTLYAYNNALTGLDLTPNTALKTVIVRDNMLDSMYLYSGNVITWFECQNNNLTIPKIPYPSAAATGFFYYPQSKYRLPQKVYASGDQIDLSNQYIKADRNAIENFTAYTLKLYDGTELTSGVDFTEVNGVITLSAEQTDSVYCEMINPALPNLTLQTDNFWINPGVVLEPVIKMVSSATDNITFSLTTSAIEDVFVDWGDGIKMKYTIDGSTDIMGLQSDTIIVYGNSISSANLQSLGLTYIDVTKATGLYVLNCSYNQLESIDVSNNTLLETLECSYNNITALDVTKNVELFDLRFENNKVINIDLSQNAKLGEINCRHNQLEELILLDKPSLQNVWCDYNNLRELDLTQISSLSNEYTNNYLTISTLPEIGFGDYVYAPQKKMQLPKNLFIVGDTLNLGSEYSRKSEEGNSVVTVYSLHLSDGTALTIDVDYTFDTGMFIFLKEQPDSVYCQMTNATIDQLTLVTENFWIDKAQREPPVITFKNTSVSEVSLWLGASEANAQVQIDWGDGVLHDYSIAQFTNVLLKGTNISNIAYDTVKIYGDKIVQFTCADNPITYLDITNCQALEYLDCGSNSFIAMDLSQNSALTYLDISSTRIKNFDISQNTALQSLYCSRSGFTSLDVSQNVNLKLLSCFLNGITELDLSNNSALTDINCRNNRLTNLDLSNNPLLAKVNCKYNDLESLTFPSNPRFTSVECDINRLTIETLSVLGSATYLYAPQALMPLAKKYFVTGDTLNLSSQFAKNDIDGISQTTTYTLRLADSTALTVDVDYTFDNGLIIFLKEQADSIYCQMVNPALPDLMLVTENFWVGSTPVPSLAFEMVSEFSGELTFSVSTDGPEEGFVDFGDGVLHSYSFDYTSTDIIGTPSDTIKVYANSAIGLTVESAELVYLDVSESSLLSSLICSNNTLSSLDVSQNMQLSYLDCSYNNLNAIDVTMNPQLSDLLCAGNNLTLLELWGNYDLNTLDCSNNALTELDIYDNMYLTELIFDNNDISFIDLFNNYNLSNISYTNNKFTISSIPQLNTTSSFNYVPQQKMSLYNKEFIVGDSLVLSSELYKYDIDNIEQVTNYSLYRTDQTELVVDVDYTISDGLIIFLTKQSDSVYCQMINSALPDLVLETENFWVGGADMLPLAIVLTNSSVSEVSLWFGASEPDAPIQIDWGDNILINYSISEFTNVLLKGTNISNTAYDTVKIYGDKIVQFTCADNPISYLDVTQCTSLEYLDCGSNSFITLDVTHNTALTYLDISSTRIKDFDISQNIALQMLYCSRSGFTSLDVSQNVNLKELSCFLNGITELELSNIPALITLHCQYNNLTSLDVSQNFMLETLSCTGNDLQSLVVNEDPAFSSVYLNVNNLTIETLPVFNADTYVYAPQAILPLADKNYTVGDTLNLNPQFSKTDINGLEQTTAYTLRLADSTALTVDVDYTFDNGLIIFLKEQIDSVYCQMVNPALPDLMLVTENFWVDIDLPSLAFSLSSIAGDNISFKIGAVADTTIYIDWGDGALDVYVAGGTPIYVSGLPSNDIRIYGEGITFFDCSWSVLNRLDVSSLPDLEKLLCHHNNIKTLDVSANGLLKYVDCSSNELAKITLPETGELDSIDCSDNKLNIATLPDPYDYYGLYTYSPQSELLVTDKTIPLFDTLDLSSQLNKKGADGSIYQTAYIWRTTSNYTLLKGEDYNELDGRFIFLKPQLDSIFCEMKNPALAGFTLITENIKVLEKPLTASYSILQNIACHGDATAIVVIEAEGGVPPYVEYAWPDADNAQEKKELASGLYKVTVTDSDNSKATVNVYVPEASALSASHTILKEVSCVGETDGVVTVDASGGSEPYEYVWPENDSVKVKSELSAGEYIVTITDINECITTETVVLTESELVVGFDIESGCSPHFIPAIRNNTIGAANLHWDFGDGNSSIDSIPSHVFINNSTVDQEFVVSLTATSASGCKITHEKTITVYKKPQAEFNIIGDMFSSLPINFVNTSVNYGFEEIAYVWSFGDGDYVIEDPNPVHIYADSGTYDVGFIVELDNSCRDTVSHVINITPAPKFTVSASKSLSLCEGDENLLTVDDRGFRVQWVKDGVGLSGSINNALTVTQSGDYFAILSSDTASFNSDTLSLHFHAYPSEFSVQANGETSFCKGDSVQLELPDSSAYTYIWMHNDQGVFGKRNILHAKEEGVYKALISNQNCMTVSSDSVEVVFDAAPDIVEDLYIDGNTNMCEGDVIVLSVPENPNNYKLEWLNGNTVIHKNVLSIEVATTGSYWMRAFDVLDCSAETKHVDVSVLPYPDKPEIYDPYTLTACENDSIKLITDSIVGLTHIWKHNGVELDSRSHKLHAKASGQYTVEGLNGICRSSSDDTVALSFTEKPQTPIIANSGNLTFCESESVTLSVAEIDGISYQWVKDEKLTDNYTNIFTATESGAYEVLATNQSLCTNIAEGVIVNAVKLPDAPKLYYYGSGELCEGDSVEIVTDELVDVSYLWKEGGTFINNDSNVLYVKTSGKYTLSMQTGNCVSHSNDTISIVVNKSPVVPQIQVVGETMFCKGDSVQISTVVSEGETVQWYKNKVRFDEDNLLFFAKESGEYTLQISNEFSCNADAGTVVDVQVFELPDIPPLLHNRSIDNLCDGDSVLLSTFDKQDIKYKWSKDGGELDWDVDTLVVYENGIYGIAVENGLGCKTVAENDVIINFNSIPNAEKTLQVSSLEVCDGGIITVEINEEEQYNHRWYRNSFEQNNKTSSVLKVVESGSYYAIISHPDFGCSIKTDAVDLTVNQMPEKPVIDSGGYVAGQCRGEFISLSVINKEPFKYTWYHNGIELEDLVDGTVQGILDAGEYEVESSTDFCSAVSDQFTIAYKVEPEKPTIYYLGDEQWYLVADLNDGEEYQWYFNELKIPGAVKYYYEAGTQLGTYRIAMKTESSECFAFSDPLKIPEDTWYYNATSVDENAEEVITISPNPNNGAFILMLQDDYFGAVTYTITGVAGDIIIHNQIEKYKKTLSQPLLIDPVGKGVYFINITLGEKSIHKKIIVK